MNTESPRETCQCKVGTGIQKYSLDDFNDEIVRMYREDDASLRDLEGKVNQEFAAAAVEQADTYHRESKTVDADPEDIVQAFQSDDVSPRTQKRIATQLRQAAVDVESLQEDFISYRTVKNHLNNCLDVDTSRTETITLEDAQATIGWARTRCENVILTTLNRLSNTGRISLGTDVDVTITPRITCRDCGVSTTISEFLKSNGCDCDAPPDS